MENIYPTTFVIFGATGDLFRKKLAPALFDLFGRGALPIIFNIVAFSRRAWSDAEFRAFLAENLREKWPDIAGATLKKFLELVLYVEGDLGEEESYHKVAALLGRLDLQSGVCRNKLFYLATPPSYYEPILKNISASGLAIPCAPTKDGSETGRRHAGAGFGLAEAGWTRILIEKPFGSDAEVAQRLDRLLGELFSESQIFRIDHYLAKQTLRNLLKFRFSDKRFEPLWNNGYIEKVEIRIFEKEGVNGRGPLYDAIGALRDVGQNHALQMAAVIAMNKPERFSAPSIRKKRYEILKEFRLWDELEGEAMVRGQYEGYHDETGVPPESSTETYFKVKLALDTPRWRGVPFILESGKALQENKTEIVLYLKKPLGGLCPPEAICTDPKKVIFPIQSVATGLETGSTGLTRLDAVRGDREHCDQAVYLYCAGASGTGNEEMRQTRMSYGNNFDEYQRVLMDAIKGDQTLFPSTDEVSAEWRVTMSILKAWQGTPLLMYFRGTKPEVKL